MVGEDENDVEYSISPIGQSTQLSTSFMIESHQKKRRKDPLVTIVGDIASSLKEYINLKKKPSGQEIYEVVSIVLGLSQQEIFKAIQLLLNGDFEQFYLLKSLPDDKKYDWLAFLLSSGFRSLTLPFVKVFATLSSFSSGAISVPVEAGFLLLSAISTSLGICSSDTSLAVFFVLLCSCDSATPDS
ncbi:hypothetical protein SLEP1_g60534, partial [Rubroshorea leprosula]